MSFISWNCRGLGDPHGLTVQRLTELRRTYFPEVLFLMETMNAHNSLVDMQCWLGYDHVYTVDPVNTWGGLAFFWKNSVGVDILYANKNVMDIKIMYEDKCSMSRMFTTTQL